MAENQNMNAPPENQGGDVPPEMQEQFDIFVANGMNIIHDEKVSNDLLNRILKGNPVQAIAEATVDMVTRLSDSAAENNMALTNETLVHGSNILMGEIINMAEAAGMQKLTEEQRTQSYQLATSMFLDNSVKSGKITQEQLVQLGEETKKANPEAGQMPAEGQAGPPPAGASTAGILNGGV